MSFLDLSKWDDSTDASIRALVDEVVRWRREAVEILKENKQVKIKGDKYRTIHLIEASKNLMLHLAETHPLTNIGDEQGLKLAYEVRKALLDYGVGVSGIQEFEGKM
jgi:hypothetical protein